MRCPKCHYLSFEPEPRCRNCGYDLALSEPELESGAEPPVGRVPTPPSLAAYESEVRPAGRPAGGGRGRRRPNIAAAGARASARAAALDADPVDLFESERAPEPPPAARPAAASEIRPRAEAAVPEPRARVEIPAPLPVESGPVDDPPADRFAAMRLVPPVAEPVAAPADALTLSGASAPAFDRDLPAGSVRLRPEPVPPAAKAPAPITSDLPLFVKRPAEPDLPMVAVPAVARPPLSVQRRTSEAARPAVARAPRTLGAFDRDFIEDVQRLEKIERQSAGERARAIAQLRPLGSASVSHRLQAALIDGSILGALAFAVVWFTARWAGLGPQDVLRLPMLPLAAFLLLIAFGYEWMFTAAGGQTVGKMLTGIRVVGAPGEGGTAPRPVTLQQALVRAGAALPSVLIAGVGFVPALTGEHLAVHDRVAGTRVVRA